MFSYKKSQVKQKEPKVKGCPSPKNIHFSMAKDQSILSITLICISSKLDTRLLMFYTIAYLAQNRSFFNTKHA